MKQFIKRELDDLVLEQRVPLYVKRSNPYDEGEGSEMANVLGHIAGHEMGFAYWIDMDYKDKPDQISMLFWIWNGDKQEFIDLCKELGIEVVEEDCCVKCGRVLYGAHGWENGPVCDKCAEK